MSKSSLGKEAGEGIIGRGNPWLRVTRTQNSTVQSEKSTHSLRQGWEMEKRETDKVGMRKHLLRKKCALNTAASYLEGCLSKEIWQLCERQTGMGRGWGGRE